MRNKAVIIGALFTISILSVSPSYAAEVGGADFEKELERLTLYGCKVIKVTCDNEKKCFFSADEVQMAKKQGFKDKALRLPNEDEAREYCKIIKETQAGALVPVDFFDSCKPFWIQGASDEVLNVFSPTQMKGGVAAAGSRNCIKFIVLDNAETVAHENENSEGMWCTIIDYIGPHCTLKNGLIGVGVCVIAGGSGYAMYRYGYAAGVASVKIATTGVAVTNVLSLWERTRASREVISNAGYALRRLWCPTWFPRD